MSITCENCNKTFSTKYTLKKHTETQKCNSDSEYTCTSSKCDYKTLRHSDLKKHIKTCKIIEVETILYNNQQEHKKQYEQLRIEYENQLRIEEYEKQIAQLRVEHEKQIVQLHTEYKKQIEEYKKQIDHLHVKEEYMEKEQERMTSLLEKAMTKPLITQNTTTNTNTTIKGNINNLQNILAPNDLYEKQVDPDRIKSIDHSIIEKHFWLGQKGIARFCVDHIIKTTDDDGNNKLLLCCTDPSRKRFKYVDADNQVTEDIDARHFINMVSEPIVTVCREVYDDVVKKIEDDKKETTDAFDLNFLENKTTVAQKKFLEINNIGDHNRNSDYKNEMSILLKK